MKRVRGIIVCPVKGEQALGMCEVWQAAGMERCASCAATPEVEDRRREFVPVGGGRGSKQCPLCGADKIKKSATCWSCYVMSRRRHGEHQRVSDQTASEQRRAQG